MNVVFHKLKLIQFLAVNSYQYIFQNVKAVVQSVRTATQGIYNFCKSQLNKSLFINTAQKMKFSITVFFQ